MSFENVPSWIREIPVYLKTQEMCKAVPIKPLSLAYVPDRFNSRNVQRGRAQQAMHDVKYP